MKKDELRSYELLETLGLSRDILICTNLENNFHQHKHKQFQLGQNGLDKNINLNPIPILSKDLNLFLKTNITSDFIFGIKNLSPEMKQSINGTYRIIFHRMQKEFHKEFNSEQISLRHLQQEQKNLNNKMYKPIVKNISKTPSYNKSFHSNERLNMIKSKEYSERNRPSSVRKSSEQTNKSIFVRNNNQDLSNSGHQTKHNLFIANSQRPTSHKSTDFNSNGKAVTKSHNHQSMYTKNSNNRFSSVSTHEGLYNNRNKNGNNGYHVESQSVHQINTHIQRQTLSKYANDPLLKHDPRYNGQKKQSLPCNSTPGAKTDRNRASQPTNRSLSANTNGKQASKLCSIL